MQLLSFLEEFPDFLTSVLKENSQSTILEDFSIPWNIPDNIDTQCLAEMLNTFNLHQLVNFPTHKADNTQDWIIHKAEQNCNQNITKSDFLSDHFIIEWTMIRDPSQTVKIETKQEHKRHRYKAI